MKLYITKSITITIMFIEIRYDICFSGKGKISLDIFMVGIVCYKCSFSRQRLFYNVRSVMAQNELWIREVKSLPCPMHLGLSKENI